MVQRSIRRFLVTAITVGVIACAGAPTPATETGPSPTRPTATFAASARPIPEPTDTPQTTRTPYPTQTPYPTYTLYPTSSPYPPATVKPTQTLVIVIFAPELPTPTAALSVMLRCPECPTLAVTGIVDGDTFDSPEGRIRLFGADTPERGKKCFIKATERLRALAGDVVRVETGPRLIDGYKRLLYYPYTETGDSIDAILIMEGLAEAWTKDGQRRDYLVGLERRARLNFMGCLWNIP